ARYRLGRTAPARGPSRDEALEQPLHFGEVALGAFLERLPPEHDVARIAGRAAVRRPAPIITGEAVRFGVRAAAGTRAACGTPLRWFLPPVQLRQRPERTEQRVERCAVGRSDLERDLQRALNLRAIEQIDERERTHGVHLVAHGDLDPARAEHARKARQVNDEIVARVHSYASVPASDTRASIAASSRSSTSWRSFRKQPSVSATIAASRCDRCSRTSACAQSIASATPGDFERRL